MKIGDQVIRAVLDTGATLSIVARLKTFMKTKTVAIRVGNGRTVHSLGGADVSICLGDKSVTQHCRVLATDVFDIVIRTNFLRRNPQGRMLSPGRPYDLHCNFGSGLYSVPSELSEQKESGLRYAATTNSRTANYQLARHVLENGRGALQVSLDEIRVELFPSQHQHIMHLYCSKHLKNTLRSFWKSNWPKPPPPIISKRLLLFIRLLIIFACLYLEHPLFPRRKMALLDTNDPHFFYDDIAAAREEDEAVVEESHSCRGTQFVCRIVLQGPYGRIQKN